MSMTTIEDCESGFTEDDISFARETFFRDCPNGRCSKQKFLAFIRQSQKPVELNIHLIKVLQNYRQTKKFFSMMFDIYDRNHDGELDFNEYLYALSAISGANRIRTLETLFCFFDVHNRGYITREDFNTRKKLAAQFLGHYKTGVKHTSIYDQGFKEMDLNQDGHISKDEFIQWHFREHAVIEENKPIRRRTRLFRNLSTFVEHRGQIKTSSLQHKHKYSQEFSIEYRKNINQYHQHHPHLTSTVHVDQYLMDVFRRARRRFHHEKNKARYSQSDSGAFTSSARTIDTDEQSDLNSFFDIDECDQRSMITDENDNELLCQSLEAVLIETLIELRQHRKRSQRSHLITSIDDDDQQLLISRL